MKLGNRRSRSLSPGAGRLPDGSPDLYFRGFFCWNSEVGAKTLGMASSISARCARIVIDSVEDFEEITIRHSKYAASRFAHEAAPALNRFANSSPLPFVNGLRRRPKYAPTSGSPNRGKVSPLLGVGSPE
jgi:hypothetical protein